MPRPRREKVVIVQVKQWLIPGRDDDVIGYLNSIPGKRRAGAVVKAMRGGLQGLPQLPTEEEEMDSILNGLGTAWLGSEE